MGCWSVVAPPLIARVLFGRTMPFRRVQPAFEQGRV